MRCAREPRLVHRTISADALPERALWVVRRHPPVQALDLLDGRVACSGGKTRL
jgi:hypothetical protein